jgi:Fe-S-cluster containining protein
MSEVKCGSCQACCKNALIVLFPDQGDVIADYDTEILEWPGQGEVHKLKHKGNGDCSYLGENGCTIYDRRPILCRAFDCRKNYLMWTRARREALPWVEVWKAAKARLHTLTGEERLECITHRKNGTQDSPSEYSNTMVNSEKD